MISSKKEFKNSLKTALNRDYNKINYKDDIDLDSVEVETEMLLDYDFENENNNISVNFSTSDNKDNIRYNQNYDNEHNGSSLFKKKLKINDSITYDQLFREHNNKSSSNFSISLKAYYCTEAKEILLEEASKNDIDITTSNNVKSNKLLSAKIKYINEYTKTGWSKLSIETFNSIQAEEQAYLAGYLEGKITSQTISDFYDNIDYNHLYTKGGDIKKYYKQIKVFFSNMFKQFNNNIDNPSKFLFQITEDTNVWDKMLLGWYQFLGLYEGYLNSFNSSQSNNQNKIKLSKISIGEMLMLQADGEMFELIHYFSWLDSKKQSSHTKNANNAHNKDSESGTFIGDKNYFKNVFHIDQTNPEKIWEEFISSSHCSAMIKIVKDKDSNEIKDILAGHTTWADYYEILRIFKHYKFSFNGMSDESNYTDNKKNNTNSKSFIPNTQIVFSGYPGAISSTDDYYITNNKLLVMETTIEILDADKFRYTKPLDKFIPNFLRVLYATRFARNSKEWTSLFSIYNSGTYSSQWMIIDYKVFSNIKENYNKNNIRIKNSKMTEINSNSDNYYNLLYITEQTPVRILSHDITNYLISKTYFASYNRAFLDETKLDLNSALIKHLYGDYLTNNQNSHRAILFKQLEARVTDIYELKDVLRYNNFGNKVKIVKNDPSINNASKGISARFDLYKDKKKRKYTGGVDTKVCNSKMINDYESLVVNGPSSNQNSKNKYLKEFKFPKFIKHKGIPRVVNFHSIIIGLKDFE